MTGQKARQFWDVRKFRVGSSADILPEFVRPAATRRSGVVQPLNFQDPGFERPLLPLAVVRSGSWRPTAVG